MLHTFYHLHLYCINVPEDVGCSVACPCWFKVLQSCLNLCLQAWIGKTLGSFTWHFHGCKEGNEVCKGPCLPDITISKRPTSLSSKKLGPRQQPHSQLFIRTSSTAISPFIVPHHCQNPINRTLGKLGAIVHTFYCPTINTKLWKTVLWANIEDLPTQTQAQITSAPGHS